MTQSPYAVRTALFAALNTFTQVTAVATGAVVVYGDPGVYQPGLVISLADLRQPKTRPTLGTNRSRESICEQDITVSSYRDGGPEIVPVIEAEVDALMTALELYLGANPQELLAGAAYDSWVSDSVLNSPVTVWAPDVGGVGRNSSGTITVTAKCRYHVGTG